MTVSSCLSQFQVSFTAKGETLVPIQVLTYAGLVRGVLVGAIPRDKVGVLKPHRYFFRSFSAQAWWQQLRWRVISWHFLLLRDWDNSVWAPVLLLLLPSFHMGSISEFGGGEMM